MFLTAPELVSPAVLERAPLMWSKEGRKKVPKLALVEALKLTTSSEGRLQAVPLSDPRDAVSVTPLEGMEVETDTRNEDV